MPGSKINGFSLAYTLAGGVIFWSGITGQPLSGTVQGLLKGQAPTALPQADQTTADTGSTGTSPQPGVSLPASAIAAKNQAIGKLLAAPYGWSTGQEWNDLVALWNQESGWNNLAQNPTSTAHGIAQFLDTTWAPYGPKTDDATLQIKYGLEYIKDRYGDPIAAWQHETQNNWY